MLNSFKDLVQFGKVGVEQANLARYEFETGLSKFQIPRVGIQPDQQPIRAQLGCNHTGVPTPAQRAIDNGFSGSQGKSIENFAIKPAHAQDQLTWVKTYQEMLKTAVCKPIIYLQKCDENAIIRSFGFCSIPGLCRRVFGDN